MPRTPKNTTPLTPVQWNVYQANTKLVTWVVRRYYAMHAADREIIESAADDALIRCCRSFQFPRGLQFSTYSTPAVQRAAADAAKRITLQAFAAADRAVPTPDAIDDVDRADAGAGVRAACDAVLDAVPERWRLVWLARQDGRTLAALGLELGLSKERVRQIEEKVRDLLADALWRWEHA